ncbi:pectin lyase [Parachaetomium inaequale]|uniref:Pectin lyase n=1 Tax=Parachaetomium inaequale TaxID=2588326 RepID=A0AAN6SKU0_9PEZI|nr:pectin lyase [Parachaetomium inaequale]
MKAILIQVLCGALLSTYTQAVDFYVSTSGTDSGIGTKDLPFRTIPQAQQAVRKQIVSSLTEPVNVHVASGVYTLSAPLTFTVADSGKNGIPVNWIGIDATISGGLKVTGWKQDGNGIYSASVPAGTKSRNLYVNGIASNLARRKVNRKDFTYTATGLTWTNPANDWIQTTEGITGAEIRWINSFTDRYARIRTVANRQAVMEQTAWKNQIQGYDTVNKPNADFGCWVQNARALLSEGGQFYLDSAAGKVYYKPQQGENMATADTWLGLLEAVVIVGGTYDHPAHDINFDGFGIAHSTWLKPGQGYGYVDQQTGGYIGENASYPDFEATRPHWHQMPGAIQISAAQRITFTGGNYTQLGGGGFGIGNDANAHATKVGLGASGIAVREGYFTQVMGNSITIGGIQADAHHPSDPRMVNTHIDISNNIFYNNSALFSSTVPIFGSYFQYSNISHNDIYMTPYSGICVGYGWGSNDAGGSVEYTNRGLYKYQPKYTTPTTFQNVVVEGNLIHLYGFSHTDLGGIYTLSKSPGSRITANYVYDSNYFSLYNDEGSNSFTQTENVLLANGNWNAINPGTGGGNGLGNLTTRDNWGRGATGGNNNKGVTSVQQTGTAGLRVAYRAGVLPGKRAAGRPVSNDPALADGAVDINITSANGGQLISVQLSNFDDVAFANVTFTVTGGSSLTPVSDAPKVAPPDSVTTATFRFSGQKPSVRATVRYTNPRTGKTNILTRDG